MLCIFYPLKDVEKAEIDLEWENVSETTGSGVRSAADELTLSRPGPRIKRHGNDLPTERGDNLLEHTEEENERDDVGDERGSGLRHVTAAARGGEHDEAEEEELRAIEEEAERRRLLGEDEDKSGTDAEAEPPEDSENEYDDDVVEYLDDIDEPDIDYSDDDDDDENDFENSFYSGKPFHFLRVRRRSCRKGVSCDISWIGFQVISWVNTETNVLGSGLIVGRSSGCKRDGDGIARQRQWSGHRRAGESFS